MSLKKWPLIVVFNKNTNFEMTCPTCEQNMIRGFQFYSDTLKIFTKYQCLSRTFKAYDMLTTRHIHNSLVWTGTYLTSET